METLQEWFLGLNTNLQVYWTLAIVSSLIFVVQLVMTFIGIDADTDVDIDTDVDGGTTDFGGLSLFSVRGVINFFLGMGWGGIALWGHVTNMPLLYVLSALIGLALAIVCLWLMRKMKRLESNGAYRLEDTVGKTCKVYLRIPGQRNGVGKIQISINGSIHEIGAMTVDDDIPTGSVVKVLSLVDSATVLVEKV